ncbi:MAG: hypothetical protein ACLVE2_11365 [Bacteroides caccae]
MKNNNNRTFVINDKFTTSPNDVDINKGEFVPLMKISNAAIERNKVQKIRTNITLIRKK